MKETNIFYHALSCLIDKVQMPRLDSIHDPMVSAFFSTATIALKLDRATPANMWTNKQSEQKSMAYYQNNLAWS